MLFRAFFTKIGAHYEFYLDIPTECVINRMRYNIDVPFCGAKKFK